MRRRSMINYGNVLNSTFNQVTNGPRPSLSDGATIQTPYKVATTKQPFIPNNNNDEACCCGAVSSESPLASPIASSNSDGNYDCNGGRGDVGEGGITHSNNTNDRSRQFRSFIVTDNYSKDTNNKQIPGVLNRSLSLPSYSTTPANGLNERDNQLNESVNQLCQNQSYSCINLMDAEPPVLKHILKMEPQQQDQLRKQFDSPASKNQVK